MEWLSWSRHPPWPRSKTRYRFFFSSCHTVSRRLINVEFASDKRRRYKIRIRGSYRGSVRSDRFKLVSINATLRTTAPRVWNSDALNGHCIRSDNSRFCRETRPVGKARRQSTTTTIPRLRSLPPCAPTIDLITLQSATCRVSSGETTSRSIFILARRSTAVYFRAVLIVSRPGTSYATFVMFSL